jgi:hypothetical protein
MAITFTPGLAGMSEEGKADEYNSLLGQGFSDAQIKAAADAAFGDQSEYWSYLTGLAGTRAASNNAAAPGALEQANTAATFSNPLNNLGALDNVALANSFDFSNTGLAGLANADLTGLNAIRTDGGGPSSLPAAYVSADDRQQGFIDANTVRPEAKDEVSGTFKTVFGRDPTADELTALRNSYGDSIDATEFNNLVLSKRDLNVGYGVPTTQAVTPVYEYTTSKGEYGEDVQTPRIVGYKDANGNAVDPSLVTAEQVYYGGDGGDFQTVYTTSVAPPTYSGEGGVINKLTNQIVAQGNLGRFGGEGYGSAEKSAADMALLLAAAGITDINQFGVRDKTVTTQDVLGENGDVIQPATTYTQPEYYNKATGQAIDPYYDRATGNTWSGTFAGEGSTSYKVRFEPDGTPIFYTQYGGSTNTLAQIMDDLGPIGQIGLAIATGGLSIPQQIAAQLAVQVLSGKDINDAIKSAAISFAAAQIPGMDIMGDGASFIKDLGLSETLTNTLTNSFQNAAISAGTALLQGDNPLDAAIRGAAVGGVNGAANSILGNIPEFANLTGAQQRVVTNAITGVISGKPLDQVLINSAISLAKNEIANASKTTPTSGITNRVVDDMTEAGAAAFVAAKNVGASDADALAASKAIDTELDNAVTYNASDSADLKAATAAAVEAGYGKFKFDGKTYTITDDENKKISDLENVVKAETTAANLKGGEFEGVDKAVADQVAAEKLKIVAVGNAEADNPDEAAYVAKQRDPTATQFSYGGKIYTMGTSNAAMNAAVLADKLSLISNEPKFADAYSQARTLLGPNKTFTWNGKEYSTATAAERPDLTGIPPVAAATDESAAETARLAAQNKTLAEQSVITKPLAETSFLGQIYKDLNEQFRLQGVAANEYLKNNPNSPITNNISTAFEAAGNIQSKVFGGGALLLGDKPLSDAIVAGGDKLTKLGQSLGTGPQDTQNWNDTLDLINKAKGFEKVAVMAGRIMDGTSGLGRQVEVELRQELPGMLLGGGSVKGIMLATGAMDVGETAGNAALEAYDDDIKKGKSHAQAMSSARAAGGTAAMTEAAIQLTLGKLADFGAGKIGNVAGKAGTKVVGEGIVEGAQEGGASLAVNLALGQDLDVNKALTQTVVGGAVGKGAATATSGVDIAQSDALNQATTGDTTGATATDLGAVGATRPGAEVTSGTDLGTIGTVTPGGDVVIDGAGTLAGTGATTISVADAQTVMGDLGLNVSNDTAVDLATKINNVTTQIGSGADASVVAGTTVTGAITAGASADAAVGSTVTAAVTAGGNASTVVGSSVTAAVAAGGDATTVVGSAVTAAVTAGADAATVVGSSVTSAVAAGGNASTVVGSSVTAAVTAGADASTVVGSSVTAAVTSGADASTVVGSAITTASNTGANTATVAGSAVTAAVTAGADVNSVVASSVAAVANTGGNVTTAAVATVTAAVNAGADVSVAVNSAVTAAANAGTSVDTAAAATVSAAINTGANVTTAVTAAVDAATAVGNNVTVATDANVTTITNATTNTTTSVDSNTGVTSTVDANTNVTTNINAATNTTTTIDANVTTTVDANTNTTTAVDANTNVTTQTTTNANTTTTVAVDANTNTTTQTVVDTNANVTTTTTVDANTTTQTTVNANTNIQTNVTTNVNTNTQVTTKVNADTGEIIDKTETPVPPDWKPPVIEEPVIPDPVTFTATPSSITTSTGTPTVKATPTAKLSGSGAALAGGVMGLPSGFDMDPAMLASRVTEGRIDPLARVREAQAELERDIMMSQIDPRLMSVMQQRMDPNQQAKQLDQDVGALAKMLRGDSPDPSAPAPASNEGQYYSYGAEDSIDDILGGKAANYKEGGFVEPLKASGGMVLPLLAKSGGALGKYNGREDFKGGKHVAGEGDGQSDDIPAWLADGEFVWPSDVVSALGNGSTKAGTDKLYEMMHNIRERARSKGPKDLPPPAFKNPLDYLKSSKRSK